MSDKPLEKLLEEKELAERLQVCPARARQGAVAPSEHWRRSGRRCRARRDDPADGSWLPAGKGVTPARESTTACPWPWSQQADRHRVGGFDVPPLQEAGHDDRDAQAGLRKRRCRDRHASAARTRSPPLNRGDVTPAPRGVGEAAQRPALCRGRGRNCYRYRQITLAFSPAPVPLNSTV